MKRMHNKFYLMSLFITIAALVGMVLYNCISFYTEMSDSMDDIGLSNLAQVSEKLEGYLTKGKGVVDTTCVSVEYMMEHGATSEEIEEFLVYESDKYKVDIDENFTGIYGIFNGEYIDGIGWVPDADYDPRQREWYKAAEAGDGAPVIVSPYLDAQTGSIMISVSKMLKDKDSVISLDITMDEIQSITEDIRLNGIGYGFVVDRDGLVVAHKDTNEKGKNYFSEESAMKPILDKVFYEQESEFEIIIDGEKYKIFSDTVMDEWNVIMIVSDDKLLNEVKLILLRNIAICGLISVLIIVFYVITFNEMRQSMKVERESKQSVENMNKNIIKSLAKTIDAKDRYTNGHSARVADYAMEIARRMGKSQKEQQEIYYAGLLHDVGKIRVSEEVINKPGKLTESEFEQIKIHPVTGYHILKDIYADKSIATAAKFHHERFDGKGYPNGLKGKNIPEIARIVGVADAYDAMTSNRSYRQALPQQVVREEIEKGKGTQFDPDIADILLQMIDEDKDYVMKETDSCNNVIMVVDDEEANIELIESILRDEPRHELISATSAAEALKILDKVNVNLILLDVDMPKMDGFETLSRIRKKSEAPVVFMTEDKNIETIEKASGCCADDYIIKPFFSLALRETVHSMLNS